MSTACIRVRPCSSAILPGGRNPTSLIEENGPTREKGQTTEKQTSVKDAGVRQTEDVDLLKHTGLSTTYIHWSSGGLDSRRTALPFLGDSELCCGQWADDAIHIQSILGLESADVLVGLRPKNTSTELRVTSGHRLRFPQL
jgi:hypothetical protein